MSAPRANTRASPVLDQALTAVRRRWRRRRLMEVTALAAVTLLLGGLAAIVVMNQALFELEVVAAARTAFFVLAAGALLLLVVAALRRVSDAALVRYVEARVPRLDALLLSAVDARVALSSAAAADGTSPELARRLLEQAAEVCRASPSVTALERRRTRRAAAAVAGTAVVGAVLLGLGPDGWRHGAGLLLAVSPDPAADNPYSIWVAPGDVSVLAGEDVRVAATPDGFRPDELVLLTRRPGDPSWTRTRLTPSPEDGAFETYVFDVSASLDYRVEHPALRSPEHRIEVVPRPVAERIDLRYEFPDYTGRAPELVSGGGDITAVRGTRVEVRVLPSEAAPAGRLVLDGERSSPLQPSGNGDLRAVIEVTDNGRYRVELEAKGFGMAPASPEHAIVAQVDSLPSVELVSPGRDTRVTSIEEIAIEARALDDVAVRDLEVVMSVNGGPDEVIGLAGESGPRPAVAGRHQLYLEDRDLAPGDLIAYYVRAGDTAGDPERQVSSDIFFMDVRPFDMSYRRGGGGGGGQGGGQGENNLSAQQRTLVVALFKLLRDQAAMDAAVAAERVETLGTAQTRIRERVDAIVRRLGTRSIVERSPGYRRMAEELPRASKSMLEVEALLAVDDAKAALPAARQALLHLQRADSAFREAQVAQSQQGGGGGSAADSDLANLFRLEMDRFRSPYEDLQRGNWAPPEQRVDDALRELRELARRQQRELERAGAAGRGDEERQRALAEELEALARELERLTRDRPSEPLSASAEALRQAARAMRRSADGADPGAGAEARARLEEARRLLDSEGSSRLARETRELRRQAEEMANAQADIQRDIARQPDPDEAAAGARDLAERKRGLADQVRDMESRLDRLAASAGRERQADAAEALERAADGLREERVDERIRRSADRLARRDEDGRQPGEEAAIRRALQSLRERIAAAEAGIAEQDGTRLSRLHESLRDRMRDLQRSRERLADQARRGPALSGGGRDDAGRADLRGSLEQQLGGLGGLAEALARAPGFEGNVETLLAAIRAARGDSAALEQHHAALLEALQDVERDLRAQLDDEPPAAWGSARSEPPPGLREDIEAYYRNLSENATRRRAETGGLD